MASSRSVFDLTHFADIFSEAGFCKPTGAGGYSFDFSLPSSIFSSLGEEVPQAFAYLSLTPSPGDSAEIAASIMSFSSE